MLPLTNCSCSAPLHVLKHAPTRPTWYSEHSQTLVALKETERVHVSSAMDTLGRRRTYVVEAYRAVSTNRIPTNQKKDVTDELSSPPQQQRPEYRVERSSGDFETLRATIYRHAYDAHNSRLCTFCEQVMQELATDSANPNGVTKLLIGEAKVLRRLTKFLNRMLEFTKSYSASKGERRCSGQDLIPLLLHNFLMGESALSA